MRHAQPRRRRPFRDACPRRRRDRPGRSRLRALWAGRPARQPAARRAVEDPAAHRLPPGPRRHRHRRHRRGEREGDSRTAGAVARRPRPCARALGLRPPPPERSYDGIKPGLDRALFDGLASAVESAPLVAALNIDPRTRDARPIHKPYLALLGEARLGLGLVARDADGVARRYSLLVPTEDGGFPTIEGRLCRALKAECGEGLIHFALGKPYAYVPLKNLLAMSDDELARRLFRDRIVLIGETQAFSGRIDAPANLAAWETDAASTPGIVLRAQTLRTALANAAPREASRPLAVLLVSLAALVVLVHDWRMAAVTGLLVALLATVASVTALRSGVFLPPGAMLVTLALAVAASAAMAFRSRGNIP